VNLILINFSNIPISEWSEEQLKVAKKQFGDLANLNIPSLKASMSKEDIQLLAAEYVEKIFVMNPKAVHILGEGSFFVVIIQLLERFGITCIESTFEKNITLSKKGDNIVEYIFHQFREYL